MFKRTKQNYSVSEMVFDRSVKYGLFDYSKILITHCPMLSEGNLKYRIMELIDYSPQGSRRYNILVIFRKLNMWRFILNSRFITFMVILSFNWVWWSRLSVVKYFMSLNTKVQPGIYSNCMKVVVSKMDPDVLSYIINIIPKKKFSYTWVCIREKKCPRSIYLQAIKLVYNNSYTYHWWFWSLLNPRLSVSEYEICHNDVPLKLLDIALQRWPIEMVDAILNIRSNWGTI